jgi:hypothetical protein
VPSLASSASPAPRVSQSSHAQLLAISCQALADSAGKEASALGDLKDSITVDDPSSRVVSHTSGYEKNYEQVEAQLDSVTRAESHYRELGGKITADPSLDNDLNQLPQDLTHLREAVRQNGNGGQEWNQLTTYRSNFHGLSEMTCPVES